MCHVALVGPEIEENLSLRYLASSLAEHGRDDKPQRRQLMLFERRACGSMPTRGVRGFG